MPVPGLPVVRGREEPGRVPVWTRGSGPVLLPARPSASAALFASGTTLHVG